MKHVERQMLQAVEAGSPPLVAKFIWLVPLANVVPKTYYPKEKKAESSSKSNL